MLPIHTYKHGCSLCNVLYCTVSVAIATLDTGITKRAWVEQNMIYRRGNPPLCIRACTHSHLGRGGSGGHATFVASRQVFHVYTCVYTEVI